MHPQHRRQAEPLRRRDVSQPDRAHPLEHELCAFGALVRAHQLAAVQLGFGVSQQVLVGKYGDHVSLGRRSGASNQGLARSQARPTRNGVRSS